MKTVIVVMAIIASFSANANEEYGSYNNDPTAEFDASSVVNETVTISWKRVEQTDVLSSCNKLRKRYNIAPLTMGVNGCSVWMGSSCTIITAKLTTMRTMGHEVRHCFQQYWH